MANPNHQIDAEDVTGSCQVCGHPDGIVFNRGRNMYGLSDGTVLCNICLGQHTKWMHDNDQWTGDAETVKLQEVHALGLVEHWKRLFK